MTHPAIVAADAVLGPHWRLKASIRADLFDRQLELYDHPARRKAAHPGRRAGKSEGLPRFACMDALDCGFNEVVIMGGETKAKAEALYWAQLNRLVKDKGLPLEWNGQAKAFLNTRKDGSGIYLWGMKDRGAADMLRGFKVRAAYFDEVMTYAQHLKYLANSAIGPALRDLGGTLVFAGTPSLTRAGDWFEICAGVERGWAVFHWTVRENRAFPRPPEEALAEERSDRGLTLEQSEEDAAFQREWMGRFVNDASSQVYKYLPERNDVQGLPPGYEYRPDGRGDPAWHHVLASDFGVADPCASVVLAAHPHRPVVYVLEGWKAGDLTTDQAAERNAMLCDRYEVVSYVGDTGGLGAAYAKEWSARHAGKVVRPGGYALPAMEHADKREKLSHIELVNADLRHSRLMLCQPACKEVSAEIQSLPWAPNRTQEHAGYPNHYADAVLYGVMKFSAYLNRAPETSPSPHRDPNEFDRWQERREAEQAQQSEEERLYGQY